LLKGIAPVLLVFIWLELGWSWWLPTALFLCFLLASPPAAGLSALLVTAVVSALQVFGVGFALWAKVPPATATLVLVAAVSLPWARRLPGMGGGLLAGVSFPPPWALRARAVCVLVVAGALCGTALRSASIPACLALGCMYFLLCRRLGSFAPPGERLLAGTARLTLVLLLLSLAFSLLLLEGGARLLFAEAGPSGAFQPDPRYLFLLRPGGSTTNVVPLSDGGERRIPMVISEQGIRERLLPPKGEGEFRIAMLGDSFTMGSAVAEENCISRLLEGRILAEMPDANIRVINCGVGGGGVLQELGMLRERILPLKPDLVILQLFPSNDVDNALGVVGKRQRAYYEDWHSTLRDYRFGSLPQVRAERWMLRNVRVYQTVRRSTGKPWIRSFLESLRLFSPVRESYRPSEDRPDTLEVDLAEWYPELEEGLEIMKEHILQMRDECRERGVDFMAYSIPLREEVSDAPWEELTGYYPSVGYERMKGLRRLDAFLDAEGIPRVAVAEALRAADTEGELYYPLDGHLSEFGNDVVARVWAEYLAGGYLRERLSVAPR